MLGHPLSRRGPRQWKDSKYGLPAIRSTHHEAGLRHPALPVLRETRWAKRSGKPMVPQTSLEIRLSPVSQFEPIDTLPRASLSWFYKVATRSLASVPFHLPAQCDITFYSSRSSRHRYLPVQGGTWSRRGGNPQDRIIHTRNLNPLCPPILLLVTHASHAQFLCSDLRRHGAWIGRGKPNGPPEHMEPSSYAGMASISRYHTQPLSSSGTNLARTYGPMTT